MLKLGQTAVVFVILWMAACSTSTAFSPAQVTFRYQHLTSLKAGKRNAHHNRENHLLQEFSLHTGEILNPYAILKVPRDAEVSEIKQSYRALSRRYHPDTMRHRDILPGSCNNMDEVRDEWERIKLSYEILKNKRTRKRYDRHEMMADPGAAMTRAAMDAMGSGFKNVGKGIFGMGSFAVNQIMKTDNDKRA